MKLFYIDTSSSWLYTAIMEDNTIKAKKKMELASQMSKYTLEKVQELFEEAAITPKDIDKIVVVAGPGSYTGIRIGMTFAKIFAYTFNKEIIPITSLEAMTYSTDSKSYLVPVIDARRGFVYAGVYKENSSILENQYIKLSKLIAYLKNLPDKCTFIVEAKYLDTLKKMLLENSYQVDVVPYTVDISKILSLTKNSPSVNPHLVEPIYLKLTEAEENLRNIKYDN